MNYKEITNLIKLANQTELSELKIKDKDFELQVKTKHFQGKHISNNVPPQIVSIPNQAISPQEIVRQENTAPPAPASTQESPTLLEIKSPIVGTFYRSSGPDKPPFVGVGDVIEKGTTVCIVEAMKLFNEIESDVSGKIVKVVIEDAQPVEYDQVLFLVEPV